MLRKVQQASSAKETDKKPRMRENPRTEKKNKGFLNVLVEVMENSGKERRR